MSQLLYPPNTTFNCRSVFFPLKRTTPRFYPLNDSSIQRNNHTPWSIVPMFLSHSKAEKEKHHFVQQKQPPSLCLWCPRGPYSSQRSPFGCKVISAIKSENKRSKRRWNPNKTLNSKQLNRKWILGWSQVKQFQDSSMECNTRVSTYLYTSEYAIIQEQNKQHRNSQVTSQGLQYIYIYI